jgi:hypothetical protein
VSAIVVDASVGVKWLLPEVHAAIQIGDEPEAFAASAYPRDGCHAHGLAWAWHPSER